MKLGKPFVFRLLVTLAAQWLACTDAICVPEQARLSTTVEVGAASAPDPRFDAWRARLPAPLGSPARLVPGAKAIRLAILRVASREFQQMNDDTMSLRNAAATPPVDPIPVPARGWRPEELRQFDRIRRRVIA